MAYIHRQSTENFYNLELPKYFDNEVKDILKNLDRSLNGIVDKNVVKSEENKNHRTSYVDRSWSYYLPRRISIGNTYNLSPFSSFTSTTIHTNVHQGNTTTHSKQRKEKNKEDSQFLLAIVGFVAILILGTSCYYVGKSIGEVNGASQDVEETDKLNIFIKSTKKQILKAKKNNLGIKKDISLDIQMSQLKNIYGSNKIFSKIETDASRDLKLRVALAVGAVMLGLGALFAANALMIAGGAVLTVTACLMLIKAGCGTDKRRLTQEVDKIRNDIASILKQFKYVETEKGKGVPYFYNVEEQGDESAEV